MKMLLDENLPKRLKNDFKNHEVYTVRNMGWNGIQNGKLLQLMLENNFKVVLTFDQNLQHQQNFAKYTITVFILVAPINTYLQLTNLSPKIHEYLDRVPLPAGPILIAD